MKTMNDMFGENHFFYLNAVIGLVLNNLENVVGVDAASVSRLILQKYGEKPLTRSMEKNTDYADYVTPATDLLTQYAAKWNSQADVLINTIYDPLKNYDMIENSTLEQTGSFTFKYGKKEIKYGDAATEYGLREHEAGQRVIDNAAADDSTENKVSAFNQSTYSPASKSEDHIGARKQTEQGYTDKDKGYTDTKKEHTDIHKAYDDVNERDATDETNRHMFGMNGMTLAQKMIQEEIDLRSRNIWVNMFMRDIIDLWTRHSYCY